MQINREVQQGVEVMWSVLLEAFREGGTWFSFLVGPGGLKLSLFMEKLRKINVEAMISHQPGCGLLHPSLGNTEMNEKANRQPFPCHSRQ